MAWTERQRQADRRYRAAKTEGLTIIVKRSERLGDMIGLAAARRGMTRRAWMIKAFRAALERDGVTLDSLPPLSAVEPVEGEGG